MHPEQRPHQHENRSRPRPGSGDRPFILCKNISDAGVQPILRAQRDLERLEPLGSVTSQKGHFLGARYKHTRKLSAAGRQPSPQTVKKSAGPDIARGDCDSLSLSRAREERRGEERSRHPKRLPSGDAFPEQTRVSCLRVCSKSAARELTGSDAACGHRPSARAGGLKQKGGAAGTHESTESMDSGSGKKPALE